MHQESKPLLTNSAVTDELVLDADDLKRLAALLNILMEVDFHLNRDAKEKTND